MNVLRSMLFSAVAVAGFGLAAIAPAQADTGFYIGPDGARVYQDDGYYRPYGYDRPYTSCHNEVTYGWRYGGRVRIVDRVCYNQWGDRYIADRDYYSTYGTYDWDD
jgi:hypothetical protein